ncbi:MAG: 50S ribosomal protein L23 [Alphaproteobacteria bacterium]
MSKISKERMYQVILAPHITEKSMSEAENKITFRVAIDATKSEIKAAVEEIFSVEVLAVNTIRTKGKQKCFRGHMGKRSDFKKAIITLKEGQSIEMAGA